MNSHNTLVNWYSFDDLQKTCHTLCICIIFVVFRHA